MYSKKGDLIFFFALTETVINEIVILYNLFVFKKIKIVTFQPRFKTRHSKVHSLHYTIQAVKLQIERDVVENF
jgi:hypothetical protein